MNAKEFLEKIWPGDGIYCLCLIHPNKSPGDKGYSSHRVFHSKAEAAGMALALRDEFNVYFAAHTLKAERIWNAKKGYYQIRTHANMKSSKAFFADLDIKPDSQKNYASQDDAIAGANQFCKTHGFPAPILNNSGRGIHVYWILEEAMATEEWKPYAIKFKRIAERAGFLIDPARFEDQASVLRVPDTINHKGPLWVRNLTDTPLIPNATMLAAIDREYAKLGLSEPAKPEKFLLDGVDPTTRHDPRFPYNLDIVVPHPPVTLDELLDNCPAIAGIMDDPHHEEPEWYHMLGVVRLTSNGDENIHTVSKGHTDYDFAATVTKSDQHGDKGPTSCAVMYDRTHHKYCKSCEHFISDEALLASRNPLTLTRKNRKAPQVQEEIVVEEDGAKQVRKVTILDPPAHYKRKIREDGGVYITKTMEKNKPDSELAELYDKTIYDYDMYPIDMYMSEDEKSTSPSQVVWHIGRGPVLPALELRIPSDVLSDPRELMKWFQAGNRGIYLTLKEVQEIQIFMIAYIKILQRNKKAKKQYDHLGWAPGADAPEGFIFPDGLITRHGVEKVFVDPGAQEAGADLGKEGTLEEQTRLMNEYFNRPGDYWTMSQWYVMASAASILFTMTNYGGAVINANGITGSGKSTAMAGGASFWGHPEQLQQPGEKITAKGLMISTTALCNLPVFVDEITEMREDQISSWVLNSSQTRPIMIGSSREGDRLRHNKLANISKSSLTLTTGNRSMHAMISVNNPSGDAASMRLIELQFERPDFHGDINLENSEVAKTDAFRLGLKSNYGHIGPIFVEHVLKHWKEVQERVIAKMIEIGALVSRSTGDRFWIAAAACNAVATELFSELKLLSFDPARLQSWYVNTQFLTDKAYVDGFQLDGVALLSDFINMNQGRTLIVSTNPSGTIYTNQQLSVNELVARLDLESGKLYVSRTHFTTYCNTKKKTAAEALRTLTKQKVVIKENTRFDIGIGLSNYTPSRPHVFVVDTTHPALSGKAKEPAESVVVPFKKSEKDIIDEIW